MIVTFCGHSDLTDEEKIRDWLFETTRLLILRGAHHFLLGGYGKFDSLAASVVCKMKRQAPDIESMLVLPYLDQNMDCSYYVMIAHSTRPWKRFPGGMPLLSGMNG